MASLFKAADLASIVDARERAMQTHRLWSEWLDKICEGKFVDEDLPWADSRWHGLVMQRLWKVGKVGKTEADARKWDAIKELFAEIKVPR